MYSQGVANMRCISCKEDPPNSETRRTPLLEFIGRDVGDPVVFRLGVSRQNLLVSLWLTRDVFVSTKTSSVGVRYTIHTIFRDPGSKVVIRGMNDEIRFCKTKAIKVVVDLQRLS